MATSTGLSAMNDVLDFEWVLHMPHWLQNFIARTVFVVLTIVVHVVVVSNLCVAVNTIRFHYFMIFGSLHRHFYFN